MAIDEAILMSRIRDEVPNTLRFYGWDPSAVSVGRFQKVHEEVDLENCKSFGVDVVRRISGGGAVYHDADDEITYSIVMKKRNTETSDVIQTYNRICKGLIETLQSLGVNAEYQKGSSRQCPNITVGGRKVSGSSQANRKGVILQHGTLLLNVDLERMFTFLRIRNKARTDVLTIAKHKLTSIMDELDSEVTQRGLCPLLVEGFEKAFNVKMIECNFTSEELKAAQKLQKEKFSTDKWTSEGKI
jgi:lipoyltransferase/lipoate-protein ligase